MSITTLWNGMEVLEIVNPARGFCTCIGNAPSKNRRCQNPIAIANHQEAQRQILALHQYFNDPAELRRNLSQIASLCLCRRFHQDQAPAMTEQWYGRIVVVLRTAEHVNLRPVTSHHTNLAPTAVTSIKRDPEEAAIIQLRQENEHLRRENAEVLRREAETTRSMALPSSSSPPKMKTDHPARKSSAERVQRDAELEEERIAAAAKVKDEQLKADYARRQAEQHDLEEQEAALLHAAEERRKEIRREARRERRAARQAEHDLRVEKAEQARTSAEAKEEENRIHAEELERAAKVAAEEESRLRDEEVQRARDLTEAEEEAEQARESIKAAEQAERTLQLKKSAEEEKARLDMKLQQDSVNAWAAAWTKYERGWSVLSRISIGAFDDSAQHTVAWPVKDGTLESVSKTNIEEFFYHAPKHVVDWNDSFLRVLQLQQKRWHPDRVATTMPRASWSKEVVAKMALVRDTVSEMVMDESFCVDTGNMV